MKKLIIMVLAFVLVVSLTACGDKGTNDAQNSMDTEAPIETTEAALTESENETEVATTAAETEALEADAASLHIDVPMISIKASPDKYTWYIKSYVGKNCASLGYTSMNNDRRDRYGSANLKLVLVSTDGTYVDVEDEDALKQYVVVAQNLEPNTEMKLTFLKDENGEEYSNLVASQSFKEIVLCVKKAGMEGDIVNTASVKSAPDKYTQYISDYVGRNLASCGYLSMGGNLMDEYGHGHIKLVIVADDGAYIDPNDTELVKSYMVTAQNIAPNTELKLEFMKDSDGKEYDNLVESQNIEEIELRVTKVSNHVQTAPEQAAPEETIAEETEVSETISEPVNSSTDGLRPEFKKAMDDYEAFYDDYCEFMVQYKENPSDPKLLTRSVEMLAQVTEMNEDFEAWEDKDLNDAELKYYLEVTNRIMAKMVDIM